MGSWWSLGKLGGIPVRLHWTVLLGALFFSGFRLAPGAWLGFVLVILVHELGHAAVVKATRQRVLGVDIHGIGGETRWAGNASPLQRAAIAWGGVWAQLVMFVVALVLSFVVGGALGGFGADLFHALTFSSLWLAAINLLPFRPLDGAEAWKLPGLLLERWRRRSAGRSAHFSRARIEPRVVVPGMPEPRSQAERLGRDFSGQPAPRRAAAADTDELRNILLGVARDAREARKPRS